ncbi:lytic murein transglycosylase [Fundidesulfovibrio terrae]|uniref:lytic murein transglycosylase n=1 Tax=Fundidesulfovibrio terrae TaxID=2922866 RepID=UPI001FAE7629|nr:lytic murein transglycosylase [Fundidesulfovibrio terrae]
MRKTILTALLLALAALPARAGQFDALKGKLVADGVPQAEVQAVFAKPGVAFTPDPMGKKLLEMYTAKYGSDVVRRLQGRLSALGYYFGQNTGRLDFVFRNGVRAFQRDHGLTADGRYSLDLATLADQEQQKASAETSRELKALADQGPPDVYEVILAPERLAEAKEFFDANQALLEDMRARYGVPPAVAVGLLTVETRTGKFLGDNLAVNNLASMAASATASGVMGLFAGENVTPDRKTWLDAKAAEKAAWAYTELKALFTYARLNRLDLAAMPGSIYGAIGVSQFMPSSLLRFGVDGDGDGRVDIFNVRDAVFSMANYLRNHGFTGNLDDEAALREALFRYNHSQTYVNTIMAVSHFLKGGPAQP